MGEQIDLSIVLPMYNTRAGLGELVDRIRASCSARAELVFVDDMCPQRSADRVRSLPSAPPARLVFVDRNVGQHAAVLLGLAAARGERTAVMDADLQDAPEDLPALLAVLDASAAQGVGLVCAGRRGSYEVAGRRATGRWYRAALSKLSGGRLPPDAGMFCVMTDEARRRVLALGDPVAPLVPLAARGGLEVRSIPITRLPRAGGASSTGALDRLRVAVRGMVTVTPLHRIALAFRRARWRRPQLRVVDLDVVGVQEPS